MPILGVVGFASGFKRHRRLGLENTEVNAYLIELFTPQRVNVGVEHAATTPVLLLFTLKTGIGHVNESITFNRCGRRQGL